MPEEDGKLPVLQHDRKIPHWSRADRVRQVEGEGAEYWEHIDQRSQGTCNVS